MGIDALDVLNMCGSGQWFVQHFFITFMLNDTCTQNNQYTEHAHVLLATSAGQAASLFGVRDFLG